MNRRFTEITRLILTSFFLLFIVSCALRPITAEYNVTKLEKDNIGLQELGNGKVLIYNGADILHKLDNTARLNIWIDNKALGQIRPKEYVVVDISNGNHEFKLLHIDIFKMRSKHNAKIDERTKIIRVEPTLTSNKLTITNVLPGNFEKFKYAKHTSKE